MNVLVALCSGILRVAMVPLIVGGILVASGAMEKVTTNVGQAVGALSQLQKVAQR